MANKLVYYYCLQLCEYSSCDSDFDLDVWFNLQLCFHKQQLYNNIIFVNFILHEQLLYFVFVFRKWKYQTCNVFECILVGVK